MPVPGLAAVSEFSSTQPLKTQPKPPSPKTLSGRKFLVAVLSSLKLNPFKFEDSKISPSVLTDDNLLLEPLVSFPFLLPLPYLELPDPAPAHFKRLTILSLQKPEKNGKKKKKKTD